MGSVLAAHLARSGQEVVLIARGERAMLVQAEGVTVRGLVKFTIPVPIVASPAELSEADLLINTVKTYDSHAALHGLKHLKVASALSLQNGVLKDDQLAAVFGSGPTLGAAADLSAGLLQDGSVLLTRNVGVYIGELPSGTSARVEEVVAALEGAGIHASACERIGTVEWSKFVVWVGLTAIAVLTRQFTHRMLQDIDLARLHVALVREGANLAQASGIAVEDMGGLIMSHSLSTLPADEATEVVRAIGAAMEAAGVTGHKVSALQDVEQGRRIEVEETLGYALARAGQLGIAVPSVETCYRLLAAINRSLIQP